MENINLKLFPAQMIVIASSTQFNREHQIKAISSTHDTAKETPETTLIYPRIRYLTPAISRSSNTIIKVEKQLQNKNLRFIDAREFSCPWTLGIATCFPPLEGLLQLSNVAFSLYLVSTGSPTLDPQSSFGATPQKELQNCSTMLCSPLLRRLHCQCQCLFNISSKCKTRQYKFKTWDRLVETMQSLTNINLFPQKLNAR